MDRPVAFVSGASRGIGAEAAVALARVGFNVAISARTVHEGEGRDADGRPVPGSLDATAARIQEAGGEAFAVPMDLLDRASVANAAAETLGKWGCVDVLVNNAIYKGPGDQDPLLGTPVELIEQPLQANVLSQLVLIDELLPQMMERESGIVINMCSLSARMDPYAPIGEGGWGFGYAMSKAAFERVAGFINLEAGARGVTAYNIEPGFVVSGPYADEVRAKYPGIDTTPPEAIGAAIAWLATSPDATQFVGKLVHGPRLAAEL